MSALGEKTLMLLLTDTESVEEMVRHGLNVKIVPTDRFRPVVEWTFVYYQQSSVAPTSAVLRERFGPDLFTDNQIDLDEDVEETVEWAIGDLEGTFIQQQVGLFTRKLATEIGSAPPEQRVERLGMLSAELMGYVLDLQPRTTHVDIRESGPALMNEYEIAATTEGVRGMAIGIDSIDQHLGGIWEGELLTVAGPPGTGKSFLANYTAYHEWARGRNTTIFTLENSILMTQMRIACMALHIDIEDLQTGTLDDEDVKRLHEWCNDVLLVSDTPMNIISPDMVNRSPQALIQAARAYETESLVIDQLTHIEPVDQMNRDKRNEEVRKIVQMLGTLINTGRQKLPCMLLHQVNREGVKYASSTGRVQMSHMAESSEIERSSSVVMALYASEENVRMGRMELQMLKQRRVRPKHWELSWEPWRGLVHVNHEVDFTDILNEPEGQGAA